MAAQRPLEINAPALAKYNYPASKLDPKAKEHLLIGKKVSLLKNLDEKRNMALAALAISAILLVGGLILSFMVSPALGSILITGSVMLATVGSLFFVFKKYLDPKERIEFDKEDLRFGVFEKVLQYDTDRLEGYDLLQRAIEDRSLEPEDKEKVYTAVRQLKRALNRMDITKDEFEKTIHAQYLDTLKKYKNDRDDKIASLTSSGDEKNAEIYLINKVLNQNLIPWNKWKENSNIKNSDQHKNAVNSLNLLYDDLLKNLGKPEPLSWNASLWQKTRWGKVAQ